MKKTPRITTAPRSGGRGTGGVRVTQHQVVTLAVLLLGGDQHVVDTEDVAMKAAELAPGRFNWRKYPEQVNLELVRVFLSDAKKPEFGALVAGSGTKGWTLTLAGLAWARERGELLLDSDMRRTREQKRSSAFSEVRWRTERTRIQSTSAWRRWASGDTGLSSQEVAEVFRIDSYSNDQTRQLKINRQLALFTEDAEIHPFLMKIVHLVAPAKETS